MIATAVATAKGSPFGWVESGGDAVDALDAQGEGKFIEDDNSTSLLSNTLSGFSFSAIPSGSVIDSVFIHYYTGQSAAGAGNVRYRLTLSAVNVDGTYLTTGGSWTERNIDITGTKPGGGTWTKADLEALVVRFQGDGTGGAGVFARVDFLEIVANYTPPSASFIIIS